MHQRLVGVVARHTSDPAILGRIAAAARQPVALKTNVLDAVNSQQLFGEKCSMARSAKFVLIAGTQGRRIKNVEILTMTAFDGSNMVHARPVAAFTTDPRNHII